MVKKWEQKHRDNQALIEDFLNNGGKITTLGSPPGVNKEFDKKLNRFYSSTEWKEVRAKVLDNSLSVCNYCGNSSHLQVDHIKPLRYFWDLRLDMSNLQVLCSSCNREKGNQTYQMGFLGKHNQGLIHDRILSNRKWKIETRIKILEKQISPDNSDEINEGLRRQIIQLQALL